MPVLSGTVRVPKWAIFQQIGNRGLIPGPPLNLHSAAGQALRKHNSTWSLQTQKPSDVSTRCCPLNHSYIIRLTSGRNGYDYIKAMTFTSDEDSSLMAKQWNSEMT